MKKAELKQDGKDMIKKAVITAAGRGTRQYPASNTIQKELFPLVDMDGITKPTIQIIAEQALEAGIEEIAIVVQPQEENNFKKHFRSLSADKLSGQPPEARHQSDVLKQLQERITYIPQHEQEGYGHAVYCSKEWVQNTDFMLLLGDHIYLTDHSKSCMSQIIEAYSQYKKSVFAVKETPEEQLRLYGTVYGKKVADHPPAFELERIAEKPDIAYARKYLTIEDLGPNTYLTFFGIYIMTPFIFTVLRDHIENNIRDKSEIELTSAQERLCKEQGAIGLQIAGKPLDMGTPLGYLETQLTLGLNSVYAEHLHQKVLQIEK